MTRHSYILIFLFLFKFIDAQRLFTVFIDAINIVVANDTIYSSKDKKIYFLTLDSSHTLTLYQDKKYKLVLPFGKQENRFPLLLSASPKFFINDTSSHLHYACILCDSLESCCSLNRETPELRNWFSNDTITKKTTIKITCRLFDMAPEDTSNYKAFNRQGKWLGVDNGNKFYINYLNDKKHGEAKLTYSDGATFSCHFTNGVADTVAQFNFPTKKERRKRRKAPGILSTDCIDPIGQ